jgi:hypothetical protein
MTRKDYILIAGIIHDNAHRQNEAMYGLTEPSERRLTRYLIARDFADALQSDNPRFDRERFLNACRVK